MLCVCAGGACVCARVWCRELMVGGMWVWRLLVKEAVRTTASGHPLDNPVCQGAWPCAPSTAFPVPTHPRLPHTQAELLEALRVRVWGRDTAFAAARAFHAATAAAAAACLPSRPALACAPRGRRHAASLSLPHMTSLSHHHRHVQGKPFADRCVFKRFPDMQHGWTAARGDWAVPEQAARATEAFQILASFFKDSVGV